MKQTKIRASGRIPAKESAVFCTQAALLLKAGVPLNEGLQTLTDQGTPSGRDLLKRITDTVEKTGSLYEGVRAADVFPAYMVQMIHIGEKVGKLEEVLEALSRYYQREDKLRSAVRSAVLYPLILVVLMAAVIAVLVAAVLPVFSQVLEGLGAEISGAGTSMLAAGNLIGQLVFMIPKSQHVKQFIHIQRCITEIRSHLDVFLHCEVRDKVVLLEYISQMFSAVEGKLLFLHILQLFSLNGNASCICSVNAANNV